MNIIKRFTSFLEAFHINYDIDNLSLNKDNDDSTEGTITLMNDEQDISYVNVELISLISIMKKTCMYIHEFDYKSFIKKEGIKTKDFDKIFFLYIYDVKTFNEFRGKGYASILMKKVIEKSNSLKYPYILLKAYPVQGSNLNRLVDFYSRFNFRKVNNGDSGVYMVYRNPKLL